MKYNIRKVKIIGKFIVKKKKNISLELNDGINKVIVKGNISEKALNKPTSKEEIIEKLSKLGDTVYSFDKLDIEIDNNIFIPIKEINELRRQACLELNEKRLYQYKFVKKEYCKDVPDFKKEKLLTCLINSKDDFKKINKKYDIIYSNEIINNTVLKLPRVIDKYPDYNGPIMISEVGGLSKYKDCVCDNSLNVVNSYTVAFLHSLGVKRITLSYELNDEQIKNLIDNYQKRYGKHPNLELVVSGYEEVMVSKYSLNKEYNKDFLYLKDMYGNKFKVVERNGYMYIYNYRKRDNYKTIYYDMGINSLRVNLDI